MGTSLIVVCLAIAGLQAVRVQRRSNEELLQTASAKRFAQAGIEFAQQRILTDASWRSFFLNGVPVTRNATGGSFTVTLTDPEDGVIANQSTDPIIVTSTGNVGTAIQKLAAYLEPRSLIFPACRSSLYAPTNITFNSCTISSNQWAYCDNQIAISANPIVNLNCLSTNSTGNSSSFKQRQIQGGQWPMEKPDLSSTSNKYVGKYYIDNAVTISAVDLPTGGAEMTKNVDFEIDTSNWTSMGCTLSRDTSQKKTGIASCLVSGQGFLSTPIQNVTEHMVKGRSYNISFWIRTTEDQSITPVITLTGAGSIIPVVKSGSTVAVLSGAWTQLTSSIDVTWSGTLTKAEFMISSEKNSDYYFDAVSIVDADRLVGTRYMEQVLLGSGNNPYGAKIVSPSGIYAIDAGGEKVVISNCRINGTIVVKSASKVELGNALSWEPTGRNFPALIANAPIDDLTSVANFSESTIGINANPASSSILGISDTDASDSYTGVIAGPIVSTMDILLNGVTALSGPVMSAQNIRVTASNLNINFDSDMILNPPPGFFADPPKMRLITSSIQTVP